MILEQIAAKTKERIEEEKTELPMALLQERALAMPINTDFPFEQALAAKGLSFICEIKKASPSQGEISEYFDHLQIAMDYQAAGAAAISCLTEPHYFQGRDSYLQEIAAKVDIPILRKDFTIDPYMIYQAKIIGASAVLLICALLEQNTLREYIALANSLGLSALVEAHYEDEVETALAAGARIIGINNRDLRTFTVDMGTSLRLRKLVPKNVLFVSESGIKTAQNIKQLADIDTDAVLIGETLMRKNDKRAALALLKGKIK